MKKSNQLKHWVITLALFTSHLMLNATTQYCHTLINSTTAGTTVYLTARSLGSNQYEFKIESDVAMTAFNSGTLWMHINGSATYNFSLYLTLSSDGKTLSTIITSTTAPSIYSNIMFINFPAEKRFDLPGDIDWTATCSVADNTLPVMGSASVVGIPTFNSAKLLLSGTDDITSPVTSFVANDAANGITNKSLITDASGNVTLTGLNSSTSYSLTIKAKDNALNVSANSAVVNFTTAVNTNTECSGTLTDATDGSFTLGYNYTFTTVGTDVTFTCELLDEKTGTVAYAWSYNPNFAEAGMTLVSGRKFTKTFTGQTIGATFKVACKFAYSGGMAVTKTFNYVVGNSCPAATDHFRTKTSGNWGSISTWESSSDNTTWVSAQITPTSAASSIDILNGHLATVAANATASTINVNPGAKLTVNSSVSLTANTLNILSNSTDGTGTILNNGTLTSSNTTVNQSITSGRNWYVSIPVASVTTTNMLNGSSVVGYDEPSSSWITETGSLSSQKGYVVYLASGSNINLSFSGALNNGDKTINVTASGADKTGFNLVGNPYPSYLNWTESVANAANVMTTIWYRTKVSGSYSFQTYNATGGIGSPIDVTGVIPPMQAFWVKANTGGGTLTFNNAMRSHSAVSNLLKAPKERNSNQSVLRLQVSAGQLADETVIYFNSNASNAFDAYDSPKKMTNNSSVSPEIFTSVDNEKLAINGMNTINNGLSIPLHLVMGTSTDASIKANEIQNLDNNTRIVLRDNLLNQEKDLNDGSEYNFTSDEAVLDNRFTLIFKSITMPTAIGNTYDSSAFVIYKNANNEVFVQNETIKNGKVEVYSLLGERVLEQKISSTSTKLNTQFTTGVYIVKLVADGKEFSKKLIIK